MSVKHWGVAEAKARFSELVQKSAQTVQVVERHGKPIAVVVSFDEYVKICGVPTQPDATPRWNHFLMLSRQLCKNGGHVLELPPRATRNDPFSGFFATKTTRTRLGTRIKKTP